MLFANNLLIKAKKKGRWICSGFVFVLSWCLMSLDGPNRDTNLQQIKHVNKIKKQFHLVVVIML